MLPVATGSQTAPDNFSLRQRVASTWPQPAPTPSTSLPMMPPTSG
ncbi:hypothetical protein [Hymenobacter sp. 5516J-16]|nr:hypothetical protein [Hymenobacter sp. 5516J-16]